MRTVVVIPTYWGRKNEIGFKEGDIVYDHATPIDEEGTLGRTLESMKILKKKDFKLVILICPTYREIEYEAEEKVRKIVKGVKLEVETYLFTRKTLRKIKRFGRNSQLKENVLSLLSLQGYANVRNMCIFASHLLNSDITVLIDDDEVIENPDFMDIAREFIGKRVYGETVYGVAGYYLNKYGNYYDDVSIEPWMTYWNRFGSKSKAFDKIIGCGPRLKHTPFVFGGAMVIHKNLYQIVAFDPNIPRGEDIDYLINAKMFGFNFFLDNKLSIKHLPPKKTHSIWKRTREDIYRFVYEKSKIDSQYEVSNMRIVSAKDFFPYPGEFLTDELENKIFKTNLLLALEYLANNEVEACKESIKNIYLSIHEAIPKKDPFTAYRKIQKYWEKLIDFTLENKKEIRRRIEKNSLQHAMKRYKTKPGETYYIPAGTLHALGPGNMLLEIQQNSDVTFRLYDWGRMNLGTSRQLHIEEGLEVLKNVKEAGRVRQPVSGRKDGITEYDMVSSEYFSCRRIRADKKSSCFFEGSRPLIVSVVEGGGNIKDKKGKKTPLKKGEVIFVPYEMRDYGIEMQSGAEIIIAEIK